MADLGGGLSAGRRRAGAGQPVPQSGARRHLRADPRSEAESAGGDREAQIEAARRAWYRGFVAEAIDRFCRSNEVLDVTGRRHRGLLTGRRSGALAGDVEPPLTYDYHGYTLCKPGPWSQAPVALQQLALLKGFDLAACRPPIRRSCIPWSNAPSWRFADREAFYGDPDFVEVPMATLLGDATTTERRRLIGEAASLELRPGRIEGYGGAVPLRRGRRRDVAHAGAHGGIGEPTVAPGRR